MHLAGPQPSSVIGQDVLDILHGIASSELGPLFYLAGGTALALQIRHRRSNDLDYFVDADHLDRTLIWRTADRALSRHGHPDTVLNEAGQVDFAVGPHRRRVSFVAYPFPSARPKVLLEGQRCADVLEIASMKAYALGRRGTARDYVDIEACVSRGGVTLDDIISAAKSRFVLGGESVFSERMFLQQLVYTEDVEDKDALASTNSSFEEVEGSLRAIVARYVKAKIG